MHSPSPALVLERARRVLRDRLTPLVHTTVSPLEVSRLELDGEPLEVAEGIAAATAPGASRPFAVGSPWGGSWTTTWFTLRGSVAGAGPDDVLELVLDLGWFDHSVGGHVVAMAYRPDGTALKGIHPRNGCLRLTGPGAADVRPDADGSFSVLVEAAANPLLLGVPPFVERHDGAGVGPSDDPYVMRRADVSRFDQGAWDLARDLEVVTGLIDVLPEDAPRRRRLVAALEEALDRFDGRDASTTADARAVLVPHLAARAEGDAHVMSAVGHSHIDSAWLWPARESRRKIGRTVANVLALQDQDPEALFAVSAGIHLHWLEDRHPDLAARVRERAAEGRILGVGGTWVEPDAVLPGGESLVRQIVLGLEEFARWFPERTRTMWLPDSFGYTGALPQIVRRAGYRWFLTQKISWNDRTVFPHHTFLWDGLEGSTVLTHFPPVDTYAADVRPDELHHAETAFRDAETSVNSLLLYGYGDGGGPTREMTGRMARMTDTAGLPRLEHRGPEEFFELLERESLAGAAERRAAAGRAEAEHGEPPRLPVWSGELYLELHRGTLTSQSAMKRGMREGESLLRTAEYLAVAARLATGWAPGPTELDDLWRTLLFCQFHDILPGTSIPWVHREARTSLEEVRAGARAVIDRALEALAPLGADGPATRLVPVGPTAADDWRAVPQADDAAPVAVEHDSEATVLDNGVVRVRVDADGLVTSLVDLAEGREAVAPGGRLGMPVLFRDEPGRWDAWDIDRGSLRHPRPIEHAEGVEPVALPDGSAGLRAELRAPGATVRLTTILRPGARGVSQRCEVDWDTTEQLLKVSLPLAVTAPEVVHEAQYGAVARPVHANTPADEAQYEVPTHRWLRVADGSWGVGVVNDGVYGCDTTPWRSSGPSERLEGTHVRLSLLRAPRFPDPDTDRGSHVFEWEVVPGSARDTLAAASRLNAPEVPASAAGVEPLVRLEQVRGDVVVDWVKPAQDGSDDVVVRLYEPFGARSRAVLRTGALLEGWTAEETDLLEGTDPVAAEAAPTALRADRRVLALGEAVPADGADLDLGPFQITTLRLRRA